MEQKKQKLMYRCKIFDIWEEEVSLPNGKSTKQNMIDHKPTVAIIAVDQIRTISKIRLKKKIAQLPGDESSQLRRIITEMYGE